MNKTTILVAVLQLLTLETPVDIFLWESNLGLVVAIFRNLVLMSSGETGGMGVRTLTREGK
jgi:hypothetical protein